METELFGGVALPVDLPAAALQHPSDVHPFDLVQALGDMMARRPAGRGAQRLFQA
jgi:hypothetical protein